MIIIILKYLVSKLLMFSIKLIRSYYFLNENEENGALKSILKLCSSVASSKFAITQYLIDFIALL